MKKVIAFAIISIICIASWACSAQEITQNQTSIINPESSEFLGSSKPVSDIDNSKTIETTSEQSAPNQENGFAEISMPVFDNWEDFNATHSSTFSKIIDPVKLSPSIAVVQIIPHKTYYNLNYYNLGSWKGTLSVYPLSSDEQDLEPWEVFVKRWGKDTISLCSSPEEFNNQNLTNAYKYTKEGVDMYLVRSSGGSYYSICFKIEDHIFIASSLLSYKLINSRLPSLEEYEKFKPLYEQELGFYELGDLSNENSELVRILKECVAELNEDDTVTE